MFRLERNGEQVRLVLDRPDSRNAISAESWAELEDRLDEVARSDARMLVLLAEGPSFCAGADLGDFPRLRQAPDGPERLRTSLRRALDALANLSIPTLSWIKGDCYGAGVALALACDIRVAGPAARFAITPALLGLAFPQPDLLRLVELVGRGQASRLLFTAEAVNSREAARIGLVELVVDDGVEFEKIAASILANSARSIAALKQGIRLAAEGQAQDFGQDAVFDSLLMSEGFEQRLNALTRK